MKRQRKEKRKKRENGELINDYATRDEVCASGVDGEEGGARGYKGLLTAAIDWQ